MSRKSGILLHPTSLPGAYGIGTLGKEAYAFVDFLVRTGQSLWQTCPLGPTGFGDSPYQSFSAFAGNPLLIDLEVLISEGWLTDNDIKPMPDFNSNRIDYGAVIQWKFPVLKKAFQHFMQKCNKTEHEKFLRFQEKNSIWLDDYALFMSLKNKFDGRCWITWEKEIRLRNPEALKQYRKELFNEIQFYCFLQYEFFSQWMALKAYANRNFVEIIGDIPLYIAFDSCDAWASPELFLLDSETKLPLQVAGVPPDYFCATGQLWGNPIYRWDNMEQDGFSWWIRRVAANLQLADILRLDHFRGLCAYWQVPYGESTAINGEWKTAPGNALFAALKKALGNLPILAEDLGLITQDVIDLRDKYHFPGMKILQFAFDSQESSSKSFLPYAYEKNCVVYTGTHDNDTVLGWYQSARKEDRAAAEEYLNVQNSQKIHKDFIRAAWASTADTAIAPMQDILGKDSNARMNLPGTASGNWQWRFQWNELTEAEETNLHHYTDFYGRL